jgi:putative ABC transport system permease protein
MIQDLRYALRALLKSPAQSVVIILTLAIGIGVNAAVYSVLQAVMLRSLPYRDSKQLVLLADPTDRANGGFLLKDFDRLKAQAQSFQELSIYYRDSGLSKVRLESDLTTQEVQGAFVSGNLFSTMGVSPLIGRTFDATEESHHQRVVVLSHRLWMSRFGGGRDVIGKSLLIDQQPFQIIGVMPEEFQFPARDQLFWAPITTNRFWGDPDLTSRTDPRHNRYFYERWQVVGRLHQGITVKEAQAEVSVFFQQLSTSDPDKFRAAGIAVLPLHVDISGNARTTLWVLFAAVCVLLLIACTNVGNLMLARGAARQREMVVRAALGASRARLLRQLFTESALFAIVAAAVGLVLAGVAVRCLVLLGAPDIPRLEQTRVDGGVLAFTIFIAIICSLICGLAPALHILQAGSGHALNWTDRSGSGSVRHRRLRRALVVIEFGLATLLLTAAGLLVRSLVAVDSVQLGFDSSHVLSAHIGMAAIPEQRKAVVYNELTTRLRSLTEVQEFGGISDLFELAPVDKHGLRAIDGRTVDRPDEWLPLSWETVSGNYFGAMQVRLLRGRVFGTEDSAQSPPVAVIDESTARRYWPNGDAVGARIKGGDARGKNDDWVTVIGIVSDMRRNGLEHDPVAHIYVWYLQEGGYPADLVLRTSRQPKAMQTSVERAIHSVDHDLVVSNVSSLTDELRAQSAPRRFQTSVLGFFSALALVLATTGIFAVMHYSVAERTREIGIRVALGAAPRQVIRLVLGEGTRVAQWGVLFGLVGALVTTRFMTALLFRVSPIDPVTLVSVGALLSLAALSACYLPARRATMIDPMRALRHE